MPDAKSPEFVTANKFLILVADDDEIGRRAVCRILEREGFACIEAISGSEARSSLDNESIDLVITDIKMEGNMRLELLEHLRNIKPRIPAILITGHPTIETAAAATSFAVSAYLLKPLDPQELLKVVRQEHANKITLLGLQVCRQRQESMLQHMRDFEVTLDQASRGARSDILHSYACLTFENAVESLLGLKAVLKSVLESTSPTVNEQLNNSRPIILVSAIQEAIQVIDRTRQSFKSKELANLRLKLEALLKDNPTNST